MSLKKSSRKTIKEEKPIKRFLSVTPDWGDNRCLLVAQMKRLPSGNFRCLWDRIVSSIYLVSDSRDQWRIWGIGIPRRISLDSLDLLTRDDQEIFLDVSWFDGSKSTLLKGKREIEEFLLNFLDNTEAVVENERLKFKREGKYIFLKNNNVFGKETSGDSRTIKKTAGDRKRNSD